MTHRVHFMSTPAVNFASPEMVQRKPKQHRRNAVNASMLGDWLSNEKALRMMAARMHRAADKALHSDDREKMHRAAQVLDAEANSLAVDADREALFGSR